MNPKADSPDLTDEEISSSVKVGSSLEAVEVFRPLLVCTTCGTNKVTSIRHMLLRRKPHLYWRCRVVCENDHTRQRTVQVDWLEAPFLGDTLESVLHLSDG